ncbi:hypothetical protein F66182_2191 [Fusarium sp. NRRL 66182]|nr:hypothetical protein F66182_2191 [Fusarium sp. NRRL 66182]
MKFSIATVLTALTGTTSAWAVTAYNTKECRLNPIQSDEFSRRLEGNHRTECLTFGEDMPNVQCTQVRPGTDGYHGCIDGEMIPRSVFIEGSCIFFAEPHCAGADVGQLYLTSPGDVQCYTPYSSNIMSFSCNAD